MLAAVPEAVLSDGTAEGLDARAEALRTRSAPLGASGPDPSTEARIAERRARLIAERERLAPPPSN